MSDTFVDSNICVYAFDNSNNKKQEKAFNLLQSQPFISAQVIIETYNACYRKLKLSAEVCDENTLFLCDITRIFEINNATIRSAILLRTKLKLSFLDSMIISSALNAGCKTFYSEDLQHNQLIENRLKIINPFLQA